MFFLMIPRIGLGELMNVALNAATSSNRTSPADYPTAKTVDGDLTFDSRWVVEAFGSPLLGTKQKKGTV